MENYKFRAWHKIKKKWLFAYETLGGFSLIGETILLGEFCSLSLTDLCENVEITQFTGRKDKNKKDIYIGDIVKFQDCIHISHESDNYYEDTISIGEIFYNKEYGCFDVTNRESIDRESFFELISEEAEVIGNIFQNKDLLK